MGFYKMTMHEWLLTLYKNKKIRAIDNQFALFVGHLLKDEESPLIAWAALASFELSKGNVCVDLAKLDPTNLFDLDQALSQDAQDKLQFTHAATVLSLSPLVDCTENEALATPFVFAKNRLYLRRYWYAEKQVAEEILKRSLPISLPNESAALLDALFKPDVGFVKKQLTGLNEEQKIEKCIDLFDVIDRDAIEVESLIHAMETNAPDEQILNLVPNSVRLNWQKVAAAAALSYRFSVISGGPGTGKTTTVAKLLAALVSTHTEGHLEIKLVAPTGKAANRLTESISKAVAGLAVDKSIQEKIPTLASTIHRLLGVIPNRVDFRFNKKNRLHLDILVIDEASMVDLALMARLLTALPDHARVILLGDRDQLASVESGAVLGDICAYINQGYSHSRASALSALTGFKLSGADGVSSVSDGVCLLRKSYRFHAKSGVGQLAGAINSGEKKRLKAVWEKGFSDIFWHTLSEETYLQAINQAVEGYKLYLNAMKEGQEGRKILAAFSQIRVLCALTEGNYGVSGLNHQIELALSRKKLITKGDTPFYPGRPVMVTQNDHALGLYNGDIGIVLETDEGLRVVFELSDGSVKPFLPSRLPEHQTAFAMTVHKSQGSEFDHTILVFPQAITPVMNRELVYTGVTRAKNLLDVYASEYSFIAAIEQKTERFSGLTDRLNGTFAEV